MRRKGAPAQLPSEKELDPESYDLQHDHGEDKSNIPSMPGNKQEFGNKKTREKKLVYRTAVLDAELTRGKYKGQTVARQEVWQQEDDLNDVELPQEAWEELHKLRKTMADEEEQDVRFETSKSSYIFL